VIAIRSCKFSLADRETDRKKGKITAVIGGNPIPFGGKMYYNKLVIHFADCVYQQLLTEL
jgi:hypothetical protein